MATLHLSNRYFHYFHYFFFHFSASDLERSFNLWGAFYFYASLCVASTLVILFLVPETRGKSAQQIAKEFERNGDGPQPQENGGAEMSSCSTCSTIL